MIIGGCPYDDCEDHRMRPLPDVPLPVFSREECPGCHREIWIKYSRIDPEAYTATGFREHYTIDEETKAVRPKAQLTANVITDIGG